jgi:hypothetical protein
MFIRTPLRLRNNNPLVILQISNKQQLLELSPSKQKWSYIEYPIPPRIQLQLGKMLHNKDDNILQEQTNIETKIFT